MSFSTFALTNFFKFFSSLPPLSFSLYVSLAIAFLSLPPGTHIFSLSAVASSPDGSKSKSDNTAADASDQRAEPIKSTSDNSSPVDETTPESIERKQSAPTTPLPTPPPPLPLNGVISSKYTIYFVRRKRMNESLHFSIKQASTFQTHTHTAHAHSYTQNHSSRASHNHTHSTHTKDALAN